MGQLMNRMLLVLLLLCTVLPARAESRAYALVKIRLPARSISNQSSV